MSKVVRDIEVVYSFSIWCDGSVISGFIGQPHVYWLCITSKYVVSHYPINILINL